MSSRTPVYVSTLFISTLVACCPATAAEIYRCVNASGAILYSDRSCREDAQQKISVEPMPIVGWEKVEAPRRRKNPDRRKSTGHGDAHKLADYTSECHTTRRGIEKINSKLRAGYTLKTGERLKERLRELESFRFRNCR